MAMIAGMVAKSVLPFIVRQVIEKATDRSTTDKIERAMADDPIALNELSAEPKYKSRVVVGSTAAVVVSLGVVLTQLTENPFPYYDWQALGPAIAVVWASGFALYGRLRSGLRPLFTRKG